MNYCIVQTREFYGPREQKSLVFGYGARAELFATRKEAVAYADALREGEYCLSHNESARPRYRVVHVTALPKYLQYQL